jgi:predicted nucleic acid-binding protein
MRWVIDASVILKWIFPEEDHELARRFKRQPLIAPDLIMSECVNAVWRRAGPEKMSPDQVDETLMLISRFGIDLHPSRELVRRAGAIAFALDHPAYDCFYLALSEREGCDLLTADTRLVARLAEKPGATFARVSSLASLHALEFPK